MNDREDPDCRLENLPPESLAETASAESPFADAAKFDRIIPRLLRNILVLSIVFLAPALWFYRFMGAVGFALGAAVSYVNFLSLSRGVEALTARIVDQHSREKGGRIVARFVARYLLVGVVAYAIFKGSSLAFRGLLWGLCIPVAALMAEAVWQAYTAFRRAS